MSYTIRNTETGYELRHILAGKASDAARKFADHVTADLNAKWAAEGKVIDGCKIVWDSFGKYAISLDGKFIERFDLKVTSIKRRTAREHYIDRDEAFWTRGERK